MSEIKLQQKAAYTLGIDVGSTTVKTVILDADHHVLHSTYQRHFSKVKEAVSEQLQAIIKEHPATMFSVHMTGSAGLGLATAAKIPFVQEVHAAFLAVKERYPEADAVIELGGEDAKIIFLTGGVEQRMNGSCAGGTGALSTRWQPCWMSLWMNSTRWHCMQTAPIPSLHAAAFLQSPTFSRC